MLDKEEKIKLLNDKIKLLESLNTFMQIVEGEKDGCFRHLETSRHINDFFIETYEKEILRLGGSKSGRF